VSPGFEVDAALEGSRLDAALPRAHPELSRSQAARLVAQGRVRIDGVRAQRAARRLRRGERVDFELPPPEPAGLEPEPIPLEIVYEDPDLLLLDKPAGLVVHPAPGHPSGTLVHALLHHCGALPGVGGVARPGIVHRLDKGTSGLLVVAKNDLAQRRLAQDFKAHRIDREYLALVRAEPRAERGEMHLPIGRHPGDRKRFSTRVAHGREAQTCWRIERRLRGATLLRITPRTGRTHQIRVHLAAAGLPLAGDPVYGGGRPRELGLERQALHAAVLGFAHPRSGEPLRFESPLPEDLRRAIERLLC
jgi:23S rRNA pseudouridine1911/1915/1917 synthase